MTHDVAMALESLSHVQDRLGQRGFGHTLVATEFGLRDLTTGLDHEPDQLQVAETVRFEGASDPDDEAILLAIATRDGHPLGTFTTPYGRQASAAQAYLLRHLHRVVVTSEEAAVHGDHDHVAAVFKSRMSAEAAIEDLREVGLGSDHLGVAIGHDDRAVFERDEEADLAHDVEKGVGAGAALGLLGGMLLFSVAVPGIGALGAGGIVALGAASGFGGAMLGGYFGIAADMATLEEHDQLRHTQLAPGEVLVVACGHHHRDLVQAAFQRHGGRHVRDTPPPSSG